MMYEQVYEDDLRHGDFVRVVNGDELRIEFYEVIIDGEKYSFKEDESKRIDLYTIDRSRPNPVIPIKTYLRVPNNNINTETIANAKRRRDESYKKMIDELIKYGNYYENDSGGFDDEDRSF